MAEKKEYKPGIKKIKEFFSKKINPKSPRARLERQKEQKLRAKGIGTSGDTDTEFKGSVKNLTSKGMARKMEDAKPTVKVGAPKAKVAPSSAAKTITKKEPTKGQRVVAGLSEFQKAFAQARKEGKKQFPFKGAQYAAYTKQEVEKSGSSNLGEFLNKLKRKNSEIAKAPGQLKKGGMSKMKKYQKGGSVNRNYEEDLQKTSDRAAMIEKTKSALGLSNAGDNVRKRKQAELQQEADLTQRRLEAAREMLIARGLPEGQQRMEQQRPRRKMTPKPDMSNQEKMPGGRRKRKANILSGAAVSENEMKSLMEQMAKPESRDRFAKGGSVMARGCKMGRKKPTKLY